MITFDKIGFEVKYTADTIRERKAVEASLTYYNPAHTYAANSHWDGDMCYYNKKQKVFNFGHLSTVINSLIKHQHDFQINGIDCDVFKPSIPYKIGLHIHQLAALHAFFKTKHGIIKVPTRGGKTFIASEAMRLILNDRKQHKVLFLVDSQLLFNQALSEISSYLNMSPDQIGRIREGEMVFQQITIAMVQTVQSKLSSISRFKNSKKSKTMSMAEKKMVRKQTRLEISALSKFLDEIGFLIVDECHEYSSPDRIKLVKKSPNAEFYLFLTATDTKSENIFANLSNKGICGDVLYEIPEQLLKERGILAKDKVLLININHYNNSSIDFRNISGYRQFVNQVIVKNEYRNQIIVNIINICRSLNLKTLGLFTHKEHGYIISKITGDPFITGDNGLEDREFAKSKFLKSIGEVLLASDIFKKGITLPEVEIMVNIGGGKEQSLLIQKKGRVLGVTATKKKAMLIDFIDECEYFTEHSLSRIDVYEKSVGMDNIVILDCEDDELYPSIRDFIKEWFNK
jgi:superfamily II DNA or RNA helicase